MRNLMSPEKRKLLVKLQKLENQWSSDLILNGRVTVEMHKTETDIRSTRNTFYELISKARSSAIQ